MFHYENSFRKKNGNSFNVSVEAFSPCIPLMQPNLLQHRLMQHFTRVGGEWGTVISILQVLILGCLGRDFVEKQSKDASFSFCHE